MSESKFTPGPWELDESHIHGVVNAGKRHIAMVNFFNCRENETRVTREDQLANAHLIAAAPDLLAALKAALDPLELYHAYGWPDSDGVILRLKTAISKAEGTDDA